MPEVVGWSPAVVEMEWIDRGARYDIQLPEGGGSLSLLRRGIKWPFSARAAAKELKEHHELLHERYLMLEAEVAERKRMEEALRESEERFRSLVESSSECIGNLDLDGNFLYVNPTCSRLLGKCQEDARGAHFTELTTPEYFGIFNEMLERAKEGASVRFQYMSKTSSGKKWFESVLNPVKGNSGEVKSLLRIARDITELKRAEEKMMKQLMKYDVKEGRLYLIKETQSNLFLEVLKDILRVGYQAVVISRSPAESFDHLVDGDFSFRWLAETDDINSIPPNFNQIESEIKNLKSRSALLVDRLDYLIFKNSFEELLAFVQRLREEAHLWGFVVILSIDPSTLQEQKLRMLEKETLELKPMAGVRLSEEMLDILGYINEQNIKGIRPSYTDVAKVKGFSKPTIKKKMDHLISNGPFSV
jgi:PAS domain S-box-containing protein